MTSSRARLMSGFSGCSSCRGGSMCGCCHYRFAREWALCKCDIYVMANLCVLVQFFQQQLVPAPVEHVVGEHAAFSSPWSPNIIHGALSPPQADNPLPTPLSSYLGMRCAGSISNCSKLCGLSACLFGWNILAGEIGEFGSSACLPISTRRADQPKIQATWISGIYPSGELAMCWYQPCNCWGMGCRRADRARIRWTVCRYFCSWLASGRSKMPCSLCVLSVLIWTANLFLLFRGLAASLA